MVKYVMFDIADQSFQFFTAEGWNRMLEGIKEEMLNDDCNNWDEEIMADMDVEDLIECYFGEEVFWTEIPEIV